MKNTRTHWAFALSLLCSMITLTHTRSERPETPLRAIQRSREMNIRYVDFTFMDVLGSLKEITLPIERAESALEKGIFFDGSSVLGYTSINSSDLRLAPDLGGTFLSPWKSSTGHNAHVFCDIYTENGKPYKHCPRTVLKNALTRAKKAGYKIYCGLEIEFHLFKTGEDGQLEPIDKNIYCDAIDDIELKTFKNSLMYALDFAGIEIEKTHHEVAQGQYEIVLRYGDPLFVADSFILAKHIMSTAAKQHGYHITFMPKPIAKENGNGLHIHCSVWDRETNKNLFYDAEKPGQLSETAKHFIAGNLAHLREMTLMLNSSVNSFKRLVPGYEAPVNLAWGYKNRSTAVRIPETTPEELKETDGAPARMEFRSPDPCCNPYFAFAGIIHAGLDGIEQNMAAPASVERNLYHATQEELDELNIKTIPHSLGDSLMAFESSEFAKKVLGESLHARLIGIKQTEWKEYSHKEEHNPLAVTHWEKMNHRLIS